MDAREFDALVSRISSMASRREAVMGIAGGALASAGVVAAVDARRKQGGKSRKAVDVRAQHGGKKKKKKICLCASYEMLECEDKKVKKNKVRKTIQNNPGSFEGPCGDLVNRVPGRDR